MDDFKFGSRNKRGEYKPNEALQTGPLFEMPPSISKILAWLPGYIFPWNAIWVIAGLVFWFLLMPAKETMQTFQFGWIAYLFALNLVGITLFYTAFEYRLYIRRKQGQTFKYNPKWPMEHPSDVFLFNDQVKDSILRALGTGVPIFTAWHVLVLWAWANDHGNWITWEGNWVYLLVLTFFIPLIHEVHFYIIHRTIHTPWLYKYVHSVHHNSVNPSPWSSLSMHPVEQILFFSGVLIFMIVPAHPILCIWLLFLTGYGAVVGHIGFDKIVTDDANGKAFDTHAYAHYLHHKYFEVNYADGGVPIDRWFGTFHDGTAQGDELLRERMKRKKDKMKHAAGTLD